MALRKISYLQSGRTELVMPVTPSSYFASSEIDINTVNIHNLGDIVIPGYRKTTTWTDKFLLPAHNYSFNNSGAYINPLYYINQLRTWQYNRVLVKYIVSDAGVNIPVYIKKIEYGEDDGTNNMKLSVTVTRWYGKDVSTGAKKDVSQSITIIYNTKTMSIGQLCNKYYGEVTLSNLLLKYNKYSNQAAIKNGAKIIIPPRSKL